MIVLLLLFLARALRGHPWVTRARALGAGAATRAALMAAAVSLSACSPGYRYLQVTAGEPAEWPDPPAGVLSAEEALRGCSLGRPMGPTVQFACVDGQEAHALRVRLEPDECGRFVTDAYGADERVMLGDGRVAYRRVPAAGGPGLVAACAPHPSRGLLVAMAGGTPPDSAFVARVVPALLSGPVPDAIVGPREPDSLAFFGRWLPIDPACRPMGVQNLSCYPYGQMDWQEYRTLERAEQALEARVREASAERGATILRDETVACTFEGVDAACRQVTYRLPVSKLLTLGASNVLIANYAAQTVRERHAFAVCSYFDDQGSRDQPAPLCREAFALRAEPGDGEPGDGEPGDGEPGSEEPGK